MMKEENYICYIGRPSYQKNTYFLVDVVKEVHEACPDVKFKLLGVGYYSPDLDKMKDEIRQFQLDDVIQLLPWLSHEDTLRYIKNALFYLTVSRYEGLPLTVIEAMSLGKAIIASDVTGNRDCVINGYNGYLLPLSVPAFITPIKDLIGSLDKRKEFGSHSRALFEKKFLINKRIGELERIYLNK